MPTTTTLPNAATEHYRRQKLLAARVVAATIGLWRRFDRSDLDGSWADGGGTRMFAVVAFGQFAAASQAEGYLDAVLTQQGIDAAATATVAPRAFAGVASDGRDLATLLRMPVITAKVNTATAGIDVGMARGEAMLTRIAATQVADAGRSAVGAGMTARPAVDGWVRQTVPPSCSRCVILAGKFYAWNRGFDRHPLCDCVHIPSAENVAGDLTTDPQLYFRSLSSSDQDRYFTKAGAEAIRDGADMRQVVNARRGMYTTADGVSATRTGTSRRGRTPGRVRLMPEAIYKQAGSRAEAIDMLRANGFVA